MREARDWKTRGAGPEGGRLKEGREQLAKRKAGERLQAEQEPWAQ